MNAGVSGPLRLVQFSDCHVPSDPAASYRGLDAGGALERLSGAVRSYSPDLVLLTGDVSEDAGDASYRRVARSLAGIGSPVYALPGNHDAPAAMQRHFPRGPWRGPAFYPLGHWLLVLLDSTGPGRIDGTLPGHTFAALDNGLAESAARHILVALHHQPMPVGSPWIDKYALETEQAERLLAPKSDPLALVKEELRLMELTANLDALTGGAFSAGVSTGAMRPGPAGRVMRWGPAASRQAMSLRRRSRPERRSGCLPSRRTVSRLSTPLRRSVRRRSSSPWY